jgi:hypothetical protein
VAELRHFCSVSSALPPPTSASPPSPGPPSGGSKREARPARSSRDRGKPRQSAILSRSRWPRDHFALALPLACNLSVSQARAAYGGSEGSRAYKYQGVLGCTGAYLNEAASGPASGPRRALTLL